MPTRVIHLLSSTLWGGRERYALDICRGIISTGGDVQAYTRDSTAIHRAFRDAGIPLRHIPLAGYTDIPSILSLARTLRRRKDDTLIHTHTFHDAFIALAARRLSRKPLTRVIFTRHRATPCPDTPLRRRILARINALILPSAMARTAFLSPWHNHAPLPPGRIHILHNSLFGDDAFDPVPPHRGPLTVTYLDTIAPGKGLETLIRAIPAIAHTRTRISIAGTADPDYLDTLKRLAARLGINQYIDWRGTLPDEHQLMAATHICVAPSQRTEAFSLPTLRAMAWGRPCIYTHGGPQEEYLTPGTHAIPVPPGDPGALAQSLLALIQNPGLRHSIGQAAHTRYHDTLTWSRFMPRLLSIYNP